MAIGFERWPLRNPSGIDRLFDVAADREYHNLFALYTATLQKNPDCWMAHYNLGIVLSEQGEADQAIDHYRRSVALRPDYAEAHYNLGRLLVEHGQLADAIAHYGTAAALDPAAA